MSETNVKKPHVIVIIPENCKGCGICVEFCPTRTLGLKRGKAVVVNPDSCTGCQLCDLRCPDFAIMVDNEFAEKFIKQPIQPQVQEDEN
ncbi:MAG TPA: 4Fe-4S binding protein [Acidobacteriota bacterium]|nr:4Fe-4S binding protein [Acidobacteriota bacterium]HQF87068.1 4Fe-4S binding protein [Acidobacteriota bacterium]HQG91629.1 4Fe-4S binding protein [Acidobacteriota bacterium]HQK87873.1 4Fe-4S binding protein [Acidobacteriota bacterium]